MKNRGFVSLYVLVFSVVLFMLIVSFGIYNQTNVSSSSQSIINLQKQMDVKTAYERSLYMLGENISYSKDTIFSDIGPGYTVGFTEASKTTGPLVLTLAQDKGTKDKIYTFFYNSSDDLTITSANLPFPSSVRVYNNRGTSVTVSNASTTTSTVTIPKATFYDPANAYNNTNYGWFYIEVITTNATTDLSAVTYTSSQATATRVVWAAIKDNLNKTILTKKINLPLSSVELQPCAAGGYTCITTAAGLYAIALNNSNVKYRLGSDIDLSGYDPIYDQKGWSPLGDATNTFQGMLDGNGFKIKNLTINRPTTDYAGLFGNTSGAVFNNINLSNVNVSGQSRVGALSGNASTGSVSSLIVSGTVAGSSNYVGGVIGNGTSQTLSKINSSAVVSASGTGTGVGGIIGTSNAEVISNSYATGNVTGIGEVGGLFGRADASSQISRSYAAGNVVGSSNSGGLVGYLNTTTTITDSYATGNVTGDFAGGLVGYVNGAGGIVSKCFSVGVVSGGATEKGGLIGHYNAGLTVTNSFYNRNTSGQSDNDIRGIPKSTLEMQTQSTFTNFGFPTNWLMYKPASYPGLTGMP
jgi:hypothetical protein